MQKSVKTAHGGCCLPDSTVCESWFYAESVQKFTHRVEMRVLCVNWAANNCSEEGGRRTPNLLLGG